MDEQKGYIQIAVIGVFLIMVAVAGYLYMKPTSVRNQTQETLIVNSEENSNNDVSSNTNTAQPVIDTHSLTTYSLKYNYSFQYPSANVVVENSHNGIDLKIKSSGYTPSFASVAFPPGSIDEELTLLQSNAKMFGDALDIKDYSINAINGKIVVCTKSSGSPCDVKILFPISSTESVLVIGPSQGESDANWELFNSIISTLKIN